MQVVSCAVPSPSSRWQCDPHFTWKRSYLFSLRLQTATVVIQSVCHFTCLSLFSIRGRLLHIQFSVQSSTRQTPESSLLQPPVIQSGEIRTSLSLHDHLQSCTCKLTVLQQIFTLYRTQIQNDLPQLTLYRLIFQQTNMSLSVHDHSNGNNRHNQKSFRLDSAFTEAENVPGFLFFRSSTTWSKCIFKATFKAKCLMKRTSKKKERKKLLISVYSLISSHLLTLPFQRVSLSQTCNPGTFHTALSPRLKAFLEPSYGPTEVLAPG